MLVLDASLPRSITAAAAACRRGDVVLVPTEGEYALATDAFSERGAEAIRELKGLPAAAPLAVMVPGPETVSGLALDVTEEARALMAAFWPGPLTLLVRPHPALAWSMPADALLAVRMPLHPVLLRLLETTGPLIVTGPGGPAVREVGELAGDGDLGDAIPMALDAGALAWDGGTSTVVDVSDRVSRIVRPGAFDGPLLAEAAPSLAAARVE